MSRDCHDPAVAKELEIISVELVEKAEHLEAHFTIPAASADSDDPHPTKIICTDGDEVT
jgi:hypothetical protein